MAALLAPPSVEELKMRIEAVIGGSDLSGCVLSFAIEGDKSIIVDDRGSATEVSTDTDAEPDCVLSLSAETARRLLNREIDPTRAFTDGLLTFRGNLQAAMKMAPILRKAAEVDVSA